MPELYMNQEFVGVIDKEERKKRLVVGLILVGVVTYLVNKHGPAIAQGNRKKERSK